jgi:hypothetical protein
MFPLWLSAADGADAESAGGASRSEALTASLHPPEAAARATSTARLLMVARSREAMRGGGGNEVL